MTRRTVLFLATLALATFPSCSEDLQGASSSTAVPATAVPVTSLPATTAPVTTDLLLTPADVGDGWSVQTGVSKADLELGSSPCEDTSLDPAIITRNQPVTGEILVADGTNGALSLRELLLTGDADRLESDLALVIDQIAACFDHAAAPTTDGEQLTYARVTLPELGDQSFGMLTTVAEPPDFTNVWQVRTVMVRVGDRALVIDQLQVVSGRFAVTGFTDEQFVDLLERAVTLISG